MSLHAWGPCTLVVRQPSGLLPPCSPWHQLAGPALSTECFRKHAAAADFKQALAGSVLCKLTQLIGDSELAREAGSRMHLPALASLGRPCMQTLMFPQGAVADQKLLGAGARLPARAAFLTTPSAHPSVWTGWSASLPCPSVLHDANEAGACAAGAIATTSG